MAVVNPVTKERVSDAAKPVVEELTKKFGRLPNIFGVMAHRPEVLKHFLPFYGAVTGDGAVEQKLKELAYLKTSIVNGCEY